VQERRVDRVAREAGDHEDGVSERRILWKHALRGAAVPIVTILGMKIVGLTSGTVLVERCAVTSAAH
jgi:ABC-type microcin C transport system permease subunit YejB